MQLYLDSYGAYLSVRNGMLAVRTRSGDTRSFALRQVGAVLLTRGTALSADAALLAVEHDIPVLLIDANTHYPLAQVGSGRPGNIATVRKNQPVFSRSAAGFGWVADCIARKIEAQRGLLRWLAEQGVALPGFAADIAVTDRILAALERGFRERKAAKADDAGQAPAFRGQEGTASRIYFQKIAVWLAAFRPDAADSGAEAGSLPDAPFEGRQRPAYDPFNALLNYLYGMLYTSVHLALLKSGLDPYLGVLHADRYGDAPTLVFDAIEPYRPWADRVAIDLVQNGRVGPDFFEPDPEERGLWLSRSGKGIVIDAMLEWMEGSAPYEGRQVRRSAQVDLDAQKLAVLVRSTF